MVARPKEKFPQPFDPKGTSEEKKQSARTIRKPVTPIQEPIDPSGDVINL